MDDDVNKARLAANAAWREMYANPGPETKEAWKLAVNEYHRVRGKLDPAWRAARSEANRKWKEKKKLGIPTKALGED